MFMTRWEPLTNLWQEMGRVRDEMQHFLGRQGLENGNWPGLSLAFPPVNIWEDSDKVYAEAELPGMQLDNLEILVSDGNVLTIQGERKFGENQNGTWHRQERGFGKFSRAISLPAAVDADKVEAKFEQGVLRVTLPKSENAKPRRIPVKSEGQ